MRDASTPGLLIAPAPVPLTRREREIATLLSRTLGEEEASDYLLTELSKPIMHDALLADQTLTRAPVAADKTKQAKSKRA